MYADPFAHAPATARRNGFTLIELLVVVAVIAVLASLLLPAAQSALSAAHKTSCASQLRQLYLQFALYADSFNGLYPPLEHGDIDDSMTVPAGNNDSDRMPSSRWGNFSEFMQMWEQGGFDGQMTEFRRSRLWVCPADGIPTHNVFSDGGGDKRNVSYSLDDYHYGQRNNKGTLSAEAFISPRMKKGAFNPESWRAGTPTENCWGNHHATGAHNFILLAEGNAGAAWANNTSEITQATWGHYNPDWVTHAYPALSWNNLIMFHNKGKGCNFLYRNGNVRSTANFVTHRPTIMGAGKSYPNVASID